MAAFHSTAELSVRSRYRGSVPKGDELHRSKTHARSVQPLGSCAAEDIVSHQRAAESLECKLADGLDRDGLLDGLANLRADEDLARRVS
jgi:hypothetical protein